ncbi:COG5611 Predicted nucleic-acid-binding protein, contains PIN domain [Burkholderiales bacterium]
MIGIDTNVLVRYIAQDDPVQSRLATQLIETDCSAETPGYISLVVLVELVWVSESCYDATRSDIVQILQRLLRIRKLVVQQSELVWKAIRRFEESNADFPDCLIEHLAFAAGCSRVMTFDQAAAKAGMSLLK